MKLDDLRRKATSGITPDRKVEKSVNSEVEKPHLDEKCHCGGTFGLIVIEGDKRVFQCNQCHNAVIFYTCTTDGCNNLVEGEGILCNDCCASGIPTGFVRQFSGKEGILDRCVSCNSTNLDYKMGVCKDCGYIQSDIVLK